MHKGWLLAVGMVGCDADLGPVDAQPGFSAEATCPRRPLIASLSVAPMYPGSRTGVVQMTWTDQGPNDPVGVIIDWGDGAVQEEQFAGMVFETHSYNTDMVVDVVVTVYNEDGYDVATVPMFTGLLALDKDYCDFTCSGSTFEETRSFAFLSCDLADCDASVASFCPTGDVAADRSGAAYGAGNPGDAACFSPVCGDGVVQGDEECDDGNLDDLDDCDNLCHGACELGAPAPDPAGEPNGTPCDDNADCTSDFCDIGLTDECSDPPPACVNTFGEEAVHRGLTGTSGNGALWFDADGDGDSDLFRLTDGLYINDGTGHFFEETGVRGITFTGRSYGNGAVVGDIDNDGDMDLFVGGDTRYLSLPNVLYINDGTGNFTDRADQVGVVFDNHTALAAAMVDYDADNDLDFLLASEFGAWAARNNDGVGLAFTNASADFSTFLQGEMLSVADYDSDGDLDIYMPTGSNGRANILFNNDMGLLTDVAPAAGIEGTVTGRWGGVSWADFDGDGDLDVTTAKDGGGNDLIHLNNGDGTFTQDTPGSIGLGESRFGGVPAVWADADGDGDLDVYIGTVGLFYNNGDGTFTDVTVATGVEVTAIATWVDLDLDGAMDLLLGGNGTAGRFFLNLPCRAVRSARVAVLTDADGDATDGNASDDRVALGARVVVDLDGDGDFASGGDDRTAVYLIGNAQSGGRQVQSELTLTVGMGNADRVDIRTFFVDGSVVDTLDVAMGSDIEILDTP